MLYIDHVRVDLYFDYIYLFFFILFIMQPTDSITLISTLRLCRCIVNVCETLRHSVILNYALDGTPPPNVWYVLYKRIKSVSVPNY